ncbi:MAG: UDP-N-acetylglucosamine--N-acetylmuramyl-(pentapeptide) pyrophosphoryl-undecaprenol N-acetylglucosamine transferase, partial [Candidatus Dormiibacterota bacterium]
MRTLIAGGGTGGHLTPALAVADELRGSDPEGAVLLVGRRGGVAEALLERSGIPLETLEIHGLDLTRPGSLAGFTARLPRAVREARRLIRRFRPDTVVGAAGYVSVPVVLAAGREGVPVLLLEQNAQPGRATRLLARRAAAVAVSFPQAGRPLGAPRVEVTGNPIRAEFRHGAPPLGSRCSHLLVWGGSQGARRINRALIDSAAHLLDTHPELEIAHQCGQLDEQEVLAARAALDPELGRRWEVSAFFADAAERVGWADLVVMRAGGSSLAEVSAMGRPMILVPYPHAGDHQRHNAVPYVRAGAAVLVPDAQCDGPRLLQELEAIVDHPRRWKEMAARSWALGRPEATARVVELIRQLAQPRP